MTSTTTTTPPDGDLDQELETAAGTLKQVIEDMFSTLIVFVLDQSGSMEPIRATTIDGFNDFLDEQKKTPGKAFVSLTLFDTRPDYRYTAEDLGTFPKLSTQTYRPHGGTALYDAIGLTVEATEKWIADQAQAPTKVLFVIVTDGDENSSTDYTVEQIAKLIDKKQEQNWDFSYLGANQDAILTAKQMHISQKMSANFQSDNLGTARAFQGISTATTSYRSSKGENTSLYEEDEL